MAVFKIFISERSLLYLGCSLSKYHSRVLMKSDRIACGSSRVVSIYAEYEYNTESASGSMLANVNDDFKLSQCAMKSFCLSSGMCSVELSPITARMPRL